MEQPQTTPMDGASTMPIDGDPNTMDGEMPMDGDPNAMGDDPAAMGGDPNAMGDEMPMGGDPNAMGDEMPMGDTTEGDDSTMSIINQLSDEDREAVRAYAESMLSRDESRQPEDMAMEPSAENEPMMESAIFTKKQIEMIMENFGPTEDELQKDKDGKRKSLSKKKENTVSPKSPFSSPKFN